MGNRLSQDGGVCLEIRSGEVVIEGNDHSIVGSHEDGVGVRIDTSHDDGPIEMRDVQFRSWGDTAMVHRGAGLTIEDSKFVGNGHGYQGREVGDVRMDDVAFTENQGTAISGQRLGDFRLHDVEVRGNKGSGFLAIDGGNVAVTNSTFERNRGDGFHIGHSMAVELTNVDLVENDGNGFFVHGAPMGAWATIEESTIRENGRHGLTVRYGNNKHVEVDVNDTEIDDNRRLAIRSSGSNEAETAGVRARNVDLRGGLVVSFDRQSLDIGTRGAEDFETDALNVNGTRTAGVSAAFYVGSDGGHLWAETDEGWRQRGQYRTTDGAFEEVIGPGTWAATASSASTQTETPRGTDTDASTPSGAGGDGTSTDTATPIPADPQTDTPQATGEPGGDRPTRTEEGTYYPERPTDSPRSPIEAGTPAADEAAATGPDDPDEAGTNTGGDEDVGAPAGGTDDGSAMDGPGFGPLATLIAILASALLVRRRS